MIKQTSKGPINIIRCPIKIKLIGKNRDFNSVYFHCFLLFENYKHLLTLTFVKKVKKGLLLTLLNFFNKTCPNIKSMKISEI